MTSLRPPLSLFVASLAILLAASPVSADVLLTDTMSRASRTVAPTPTGAQWFRVAANSTASPPAHTFTLTYAPNNLSLTNSAGIGGQLVGYLATTTASQPTISSVTLAEGQSLKATFTFSFVGTFNSAASGTTDFRVGLFNTGAQRISTDVTTASASGTFNYYTGYAAMMSPRTTTGISIRERTPSAPGVTPATANLANLIGTSTSIYSSALASGSSQVMQSNTDYTGVLTATRTATGVDFSVSVTGPGLTSYQLSYTDTSSPVVTFDAIAFGWGTPSVALMTANGGFTVRALTLEVGAAPPPPPPPPYTGTDPAANPDPGRPFIWVRNSEKEGILSKIAANPWAQSVRDGMINRVAGNIANHQADRDAYLRGLPVNWSDPVPNFKTMIANGSSATPSSQVRSPAVAKFNAGLDAAVLYYLTGDTKYAQCAADILHNVVTTLLPVTPSSDLGNGGWIVQDDLLLESRILGTQLPLIYDFLRTYLETNKVYDVTTASMVDFDYLKAQSVFRTYYQLVRDHGNNTNNWSALEATCMLSNLLALSDPAERAANLKIYLDTGTTKQASLKKDYNNYAEAGNVWPESLQYAGAVVGIRTMNMVLLERYDPNLNLLATYPNYAMSLSRISYLTYPNGELISFGDGHRDAEGEPYFEYELVYQHAKARNRPDLVEHFGAAINRGVSGGKYNRAALLSYEALGRHDEPLQLLWFAPEVTEAPVPQVLTTTDRLPFAGIALQRNLSPTNDPFYGLMGFVGGAGHTHSHASGMSMEIYGLGQVLGAKSGRDVTYETDLNAKYYRVFASNNTIIVNGASRGEGGWPSAGSGVGINTVQTAAMEPVVGAPPVSPNHSFTTSTFLDDRGTLAEATQQRTLAIVRTSPTTGYYVDIFRSDSSLANEYHDYIYRNVGDSVALESNGSSLALTSDPARFASDIGDSLEQPGWRYFTNTEVSAVTDATVSASFVATLPAGETRMQMHMPGSSDREYARVMSPSIVDAPAPYNKRNAPAVVIRKYGSAWNQPFAAIYEPHLGPAGSGTVKNVQAIEKNGVVVGLQVGSTVSGRNLVQYVFSNPNETDVYEDTARGIYFQGRYAVITDHGDGSGTLYLGQGSRLVFKGNSVASPTGANTEAYVEFTPGQPPVVSSNQPVVVMTPPTVTAPSLISATYGDNISVSVTATGQPAPVMSLSSILPPGLQFDATSGLLSGVVGAAGEFPVQFMASNSAGNATADTVISIARAPATVTLGDLGQTYTGQLLAPTVTTNPSGLPVVLGYANGDSPRDAGSYDVTATISSPNFVGSATATFEIRKASATVTFGDMVQTYTGQPLSPTATTDPAGLPVEIAFAGGSTPTNAGSYGVTATVNSENYEGSASGTFEIRRAPATITLANLDQSYDGTPRGVTVLTNPAGLSVDLTYDASPAAPVYPGDYAVLATIADNNHEGAASATLSVATTALVREMPNLLGGIDGSVQQLAGRNVMLSGNSWIAGDLLVPGTPDLKLEGNAVYGTTLVGPGAVEPNGYSIQLQGNAALRSVVSRINPRLTAIPAAPPVPTGTRDVILSNRGQQVGDFSSVRDLSLAGSAGEVAVPPGTYGNLSAAGQTRFVLGIAGSTTPAVYSLQSITLAGDSALILAGPVLLRVNHRVELQGNAGSALVPNGLRLEVHGGEVVLDNRSVVVGDIIAPDAKVSLRGQAELHGRVVARELEIQAGAVLVDPQLKF